MSFLGKKARGYTGPGGATRLAWLLHQVQYKCLEWEELIFSELTFVALLYQTKWKLIQSVQGVQKKRS